MPYTKIFAEITAGDNHLVGGKGASLGALSRHGLPVPPGFVVTTEVHRHFIRHQSIPDAFPRELNDRLAALQASSLAVRSSATMEDSATASWAGQFESYLHVAPDDVLDAVTRCWHSADTERVAAYRRRNYMADGPISLAVVVQQMVSPRVSGVCFTAHPVSGDQTHLMVEAIHGLGQLLVEGLVEPDRYLIDKEHSVLVETTIAAQTHQLVFADRLVRRQPIEAALQNGQKLTAEQILALSELCTAIERHAGAPQDIEWVLDGDRFFIVQARPITTR